MEQGETTKEIYSLILNGNYKEVIDILQPFVNEHFTDRDLFEREVGKSQRGSKHISKLENRAALSLLGYSYYQLEDYSNAISMYEQLAILHPEENNYHFAVSQCLYNSALYDEAMDVSSQIENADSELQNKILKLQTAIKFYADENAAARSFAKKCCNADPDSYVLKGCLEFKEGKYREALEYFKNASSIVPDDNRVLYNVAVTYYRLKELGNSYEQIGKIIRNGKDNHPELALCFLTEGLEVDSVGNTAVLYKSALVEALNLKAAMEYEIEKCTWTETFEGARYTLLDLPPRKEEEIDMITLHNSAILNMDENPAEGFKKLRFIMQQDSIPPEVFANLLILYCKYEQYDIVGDLLGTYEHYKVYLTQFLCDFLEALVLKESSTLQALKSLDEMSSKLADHLRKLAKQVKDIKVIIEDAEESEQICNEFDEIMETQYVPVIMAQGKIFWDEENYAAVEKMLMKSIEFCHETDAWKLNVAHVQFIQGSKFNDKFKDAARMYEEVVKVKYDKLLSISAVVLANLCASYILTGENKEGEDMIQKIETEEDEMSVDNPTKKIFHLCIVNMVVGTLYCSSKNYEFGMSRIIKSMQPYSKRLGPDTWFYAKGCLLNIIQNAVKYSFHIQEGKINEWMAFLDDCATYGKTVKTVIEDSSPFERRNALPLEFGEKTVAYEARILKYLLLRLIDWY